MKKPRELTPKQVRERFLKHIAAHVEWWATETRAHDVRDRLEGLAFSIMTLLDGETLLPGFCVAPSPHPDDKKYCRSQGEDWYPHAKSKHDIAGALHEEILRVFKRPAGSLPILVPQRDVS